jgi:hypothetical protein
MKIINVINCDCLCFLVRKRALERVFVLEIMLSGQADIAIARMKVAITTHLQIATTRGKRSVQVNKYKYDMNNSYYGVQSNKYL